MGGRYTSPSVLAISARGRASDRARYAAQRLQTSPGACHHATSLRGHNPALVIPPRAGLHAVDAASYCSPLPNLLSGKENPALITAGLESAGNSHESCVLQAANEKPPINDVD